MVFTYKNKKPVPDKDAMQACLAAITEEHLSIRAAAGRFLLPEATVRRHFHALQRNTVMETPGRKSSLPAFVEAELAVLVKSAGACGFGFTRKDLQTFVGSYVREQWHKETEVGHYLREHCQFHEPMRKPSDDWMTAFAARHHLSLKVPRRLERARKHADSDPYLVYAFFDLLEQILTNLNLWDHPERIFNCDETAFFTDPQRRRVYTEIGESCELLSSGPGRECFTVLACVSADGLSRDPHIVHVGKHQWDTHKGTTGIVLPNTTYAYSGKTKPYLYPDSP